MGAAAMECFQGAGAGAVCVSRTVDYEVCTSEERNVQIDLFLFRSNAYGL